MPTKFLESYSRDKYELSTSMTPVNFGEAFRQKVFGGGGFFYPDGYGVCYAPMDTTTYFQVTTSLSDGTRSAHAFANEIQKAVDDVFTLLNDRMLK